MRRGSVFEKLSTDTEKSRAEQKYREERTVKR